MFTKTELLEILRESLFYSGIDESDLEIIVESEYYQGW